MTRRRRALALLLATTLVRATLPAVALAQPATPADAARQEARDRFDRGLKLFNDGDNPGALAEFKRAFELIANPLVLYNIGLVYAAMGRPVEAVDALDKVIATPGALTEDRLARAKQTRDDQAARIARVSVVTNVPATIEIDNVEVGHTPQTAPLRVAGGVHIVGAVASGYVPMRKEVTVAGGAAADVKLDLVEMQGRVAHAVVKTHLPGAAVVVDDQVVGKTPLPSSLTVAPGVHTIELRRPGYTTARDTLKLGDGAEGEVTLEPEEDRTALGSLGGTLVVSANETEPVVTVDGKSRGVSSVDGLRLIAGPHHVLLERGGFVPVERDVTIDAGRTTSLRVAFEPTPETRAAYLNKTSTQRTWGLIAGAGGIVLTGGSIAFLVWNGQQRKQAHDDEDAALFLIDNNPKGTICAKSNFTTPQAVQACNQPALDAQARINNADTADIFGWIGFGVGAAATVLGAVLLVTNGSAHRFDRAPPEASKGYVLPTGWSDGRGGGGVGLVGAF